MENEFKAALAKRGYSAVKLASEIGISNKSLIDKYKGKVAFTVPEVKRIASVLDLSDEEISTIFFA